jgi:HSP20 family protein
VRGSGALTHFVRISKPPGPDNYREDFPQWALLAAESWETAQSIIVRIETPGIRKDDLDVSITHNGLRVRGDKRPAADHGTRIYGLMERAFGRFERTIPLPHNIDVSKAEVSYQDGVVTVIVAKTEALPPTQLPVG